MNILRGLIPITHPFVTLSEAPPPPPRMDSDPLFHPDDPIRICKLIEFRFVKDSPFKFDEILARISLKSPLKNKFKHPVFNNQYPGYCNCCRRKPLAMREGQIKSCGKSLMESMGKRSRGDSHKRRQLEWH